MCDPHEDSDIIWSSRAFRLDIAGLIRLRYGEACANNCNISGEIVTQSHQWEKMHPIGSNILVLRIPNHGVAKENINPRHLLS